MFLDCVMVQDVVFDDKRLDIEHIDYMFTWCSRLKDIDISMLYFDINAGVLSSVSKRLLLNKDIKGLSRTIIKSKL